MDALKQPLVMPRVMHGAGEDVALCVCELVFTAHPRVYADWYLHRVGSILGQFSGRCSVDLTAIWGRMFALFVAWVEDALIIGGVRILGQNRRL